MDNLQFHFVAKQFEDKDINYLSSHKGAKQIPNEIFTTYLQVPHRIQQRIPNLDFRFYKFS